MNSKANALLSDIAKAISKNEYNAIRFQGVSNVSRSDLETVELYCDTINSNGAYTGLLMKPRGAVADILQKFGLLEG